MADPHHAAAHDHVRGEMEISEQVSTFHLFIFLAKWGSLAIAAALLFLTLWFMPNGNFLTGLIGAVVLSVVGGFVLKEKKSAH